VTDMPATLYARNAAMSTASTVCSVGDPATICVRSEHAPVSFLGMAAPPASECAHCCNDVPPRRQHQQQLTNCEKAKPTWRDKETLLIVCRGQPHHRPGRSLHMCLIRQHSNARGTAPQVVHRALMRQPHRDGVEEVLMDALPLQPRHQVGGRQHQQRLQQQQQRQPARSAPRQAQGKVRRGLQPPTGRRGCGCGLLSLHALCHACCHVCHHFSSAPGVRDLQDSSSRERCWASMEAVGRLALASGLAATGQRSRGAPAAGAAHAASMLAVDPPATTSHTPAACPAWLVRWHGSPGWAAR
jgi:hypothetical protein